MVISQSKHIALPNYNYSISGDIIARFIYAMHSFSSAAEKKNLQTFYGPSLYLKNAPIGRRRKISGIQLEDGGRKSGRSRTSQRAEAFLRPYLAASGLCRRRPQATFPNQRKRKAMEAKADFKKHGNYDFRKALSGV